MNRPKSMQVYKDIDLKLGIKSSLPKAKPTLALLILLWLSNDKSADLRYSVQDATKIRMSEECKNNLKVFIQNIDAELDFDTVLEKAESNCLFQSQLESLIVAFELVWKLAIIRFEDSAKSNSAERTGNSRYSKVLTFTSNIDIIDVVVSNNENYPKECALVDKKNIKMLISDIASIGKYDSVTEVNKLNAILERVKVDAEKANVKYKKDGVMAFKLSVLVGIAVMIILC